MAFLLVSGCDCDVLGREDVCDGKRVCVGVVRGEREIGCLNFGCTW